MVPYYYEASLIDTKDGFQCKVYSTSHPPGRVVVKPKYIPEDLIEFKGLRKRFLFEKCMIRFNLFNKREIVEFNLKRLKEKYPESSDPQVLIIPTFNRLCGGIAVNKDGITGPLGKVIDIQNSQIYLIDGTSLGKVKDIK